MPYLSYISDANLELEVKRILSTAEKALTEANTKFEKNVIDPFSIAFEMAGFGIKEVASWEISEKSRKAQKTLSNAFGIFHQNILGHVDGWVNLGQGNSMDLECPNRKIIAEIKNKYNTVKASNLCDVYDHLSDLVMPIASRYKGYTSYYVETIPKPKRKKAQSYDKAFTPSVSKSRTIKPANELVRQIDGKSFYYLVTNVEDALEQLYTVLPEVISNLSTYKFSQKEITIMNSYFKKAFL